MHMFTLFTCCSMCVSFCSFGYFCRLCTATPPTPEEVSSLSGAKFLGHQTSLKKRKRPSDVQEVDFEAELTVKEHLETSSVREATLETNTTDVEKLTLGCEAAWNRYKEKQKGTDECAIHQEYLCWNGLKKVYNVPNVSFLYASHQSSAATMMMQIKNPFRNLTCLQRSHRKHPCYRNLQQSARQQRLCQTRLGRTPDPCQPSLSRDPAIFSLCRCLPFIRQQTSCLNAQVLLVRLFVILIFFYLFLSHSRRITNGCRENRK